MTKIVITVRLRPDLGREQALQYWRDVHGPLAAKIPGLLKYIQNPTTANLFGDVVVDGVAELWFDDQQAAELAMRSPEWDAALADGPNFLDLPNCAAVIVDELQVL